MERILGSPRFLLLYLATVLGGSMTAWFRGQPFFAGGIPEMVFFLVYGLLLPDRYVLLWFAFPIRVKPLALLFSAAYVFNAVAPNEHGYRFGIPALGGFLCGCGCFFLLTRSVRWVRQMRRRATDPVTRRALQADAAMSAMTTAMLEDRTRRIVEARRDSDGVTMEERAIVQELIQRVDPQKELCHPNQEDGMCPICEELGVCLRRFLERRKDITSKGGR